MKTSILRAGFTLFSLAMLLLMTPAGFGRIFYSKSEALDLAFGDHPEVDMMPLFLTEQQVAEVEQLAHVKLDSALFTFYVGRRSGAIVGYAAIESHTVRTKPETLLILLSPDGEVEKIEVLAFHEPPEYQPTSLWFAQLYRRALAQLDFNSEVQGITGATLSAQSALTSVRKVLAIYQLVVKGG
ncbi:MAG: FMN-binding protein [Methylococcaceae bacterium]|nr:FMN-binding protein [Methylococcaceae bacterium]